MAYGVLHRRDSTLLLTQKAEDSPTSHPFGHQVVGLVNPFRRYRAAPFFAVTSESKIAMDGNFRQTETGC